jgi:hypothetical protein
MSTIASLTAQLGGITITPTPLTTYFLSFTSRGFTYNPKARTDTNWRRLQAHIKLEKRERQCYYDAFEEEFNLLIQDWRGLCEILEVTPEPPTKTKARKVSNHPLSSHAFPDSTWFGGGAKTKKRGE